jgi:hypothetical protein
VLNGFTAALRATQLSGFMLGDVFDMLENLAALRATILVRRHSVSPLWQQQAAAPFCEVRDCCALEPNPKTLALALAWKTPAPTFVP